MLGIEKKSVSLTRLDSVITTATKSLSRLNEERYNSMSFFSLIGFRGTRLSIIIPCIDDNIDYTVKQ
jgi:hypothetical protein